MNDEKFGERLRELLMEKGISQREFAEEVGVTEVAMSRYANGKIPKTAELLNMARALGVTEKYLLYGVEKCHYQMMIVNTSTGETVHVTPEDCILIQAIYITRIQEDKDKAGTDYTMTASVTSFGMDSRGTVAGVAGASAMAIEYLLDHLPDGDAGQWDANREKALDAVAILRECCDRLEAELRKEDGEVNR